MLPNSDVVEAVLVDAGALDALAPGKVVVDMGSSEPMRTRRLAAEAIGDGVTVVDAPVSGGVRAATAGTLTIMVGGDAATVARVRPILDELGSRVVHVGDAGAGHAVKALNNLMSATHLLATSEAMRTAEAFGLDLAVVLDVVNTSSGRSGSTENKWPNFVLPGTYDSGFALDLMVKDMAIAVGPRRRRRRRCDARAPSARAVARCRRGCCRPEPTTPRSPGASRSPPRLLRTPTPRGDADVQKLLNTPEAFVDEALEGFVLANARTVRRLADEPRAIVRAVTPAEPRVAIATGGGFGHLPLFVGYVATGFVDGCAVGNMFASPSTDVMLAVTRAIDAGRGVLYVYGNYGGDRLNFEAAAELADDDGIAVETVRANDDVLSAPPTELARRRGIAGIFFVYTVAARSAAAAATTSTTVAAVTRRPSSGTRSVGVALAAPILPGGRRPRTSSSRRARWRSAWASTASRACAAGRSEPADAVVDELMPLILDELAMPAGAEVAVLVNGLGATPQEELYILYRRAHHWLTEAGRHAAPGLRRRVRDVARDGRRVDQRAPPRRRARRPPRSRGARLPRDMVASERITDSLSPWRNIAAFASPPTDGAPMSDSTSRRAARLAGVADAAVRARRQLDALDALAGDGDLGETLVAGFAAVRDDDADGRRRSATSCAAPARCSAAPPRRRSARWSASPSATPASNSPPPRSSTAPAS